MGNGASLSQVPANEKTIAARWPKPKYLNREEADQEDYCITVHLPVQASMLIDTEPK